MKCKLCNKSIKINSKQEEIESKICSNCVNKSKFNKACCYESFLNLDLKFEKLTFFWCKTCDNLHQLKLGDDKNES